MDLAVCINQKFIQHFHAMLTSVILNSSKTNLNVHILHSDLKEEDFDLVRKNFREQENVSIEFYTINKELFNGIEILSEHLSVESLYRLDLPNILPTNISKVVYLDSDLVVLGDLSELYNVNLSGYYLAACNEYIPFLSNNLNLRSELDYFNAGVLVLNLDKWRRDNFTQVCLNYAMNTEKKMYCLDQDILNGVLNGDWKRLSLDWNVVKTFFFETNLYLDVFEEEIIQKAISNPKIVHYTDYSKPWHYLDNHPMKYLYEYYLNKSGFKYKENVDKIVLEKADIYIFGAGKAGLNLLEGLHEKIKIKGFIDNDTKKVGRKINGVEIYSPINLSGKELIIIGSQYVNEISKQLEELGYEKGVSYFTSSKEFYINLYNNKEILVQITRCEY